MYQHIMVTLDLKDDNARLIEKASTLAMQCEAMLSFLHVEMAYETTVMPGYCPVPLVNVQKLAEEAASRDLLALKATTAYPVSHLWVRRGEVDEQCAQMVAHHGVDLVVCGCHHHRFISQWLSGTSSLVHHSDVDVLVVPLTENVLVRQTTRLSSS
ncbi:universal stress protein [Vibrio parahaemolyticus]|uniref:universal stress protein n=1 Tax=Vibrio parahaemolyticus TaxID=670 RepID=UPI003891E2D5